MMVMSVVSRESLSERQKMVLKKESEKKSIQDDRLKDGMKKVGMMVAIKGMRRQTPASNSDGPIAKTQCCSFIRKYPLSHHCCNTSRADSYLYRLHIQQALETPVNIAHVSKCCSICCNSRVCCCLVSKTAGRVAMHIKRKKNWMGIKHCPSS